MWCACGSGDVFKLFSLGGPKRRDHCEDLGVDGRIILRWTLGTGEPDSAGSREGPVAGFCEHGNEP
jgi:hypothetical protein